MSVIASRPAGADLNAADSPAVSGRPRAIWVAILRQPFGAAAAGLLLLEVAAAVFAPLAAPDNPETQDLTQVLRGPDSRHWLGTDQLGRDVLSRLMFGGRVTLLSMMEVVVVFVLLGVPVGLAAGYRGGWSDRIASRFADLVLALPAIIILLMVVAVFPGSNLATMITLGVISSPTLIRVVRGVTLGLRHDLYVKAALASGLTDIRVMLRHILPRLSGPIIVQVSLVSASAILAQSALSFLGLTTPETQGPTWGNMVEDAANNISRDGWLLVPTGGTIAITVLALGILGDIVRDVTVGRPLQSGLTVRPGRGQATRLTPRRSLRPTRTADRTPAQGSPAQGPLLSVRDLTVGLRSGEHYVPLVQNISFELERGQALGIVGESGCGKTITARALLGLLPSGMLVTRGRIDFDGTELTGLPERQLQQVRGSRIGLISQEPIAGLDPCFRVDSQLIEVIRQHAPMSRPQARTRALDLLTMVDMREPASVARCYPHELSGGMAQRVAIALALAGNPSLLIADEPTTALDVSVQSEILTVLRNLQSDLGMAVILVTHDWGVLADLCDRAIVMYAGEVVECADIVALYHAPRHPYTESLLAANPHIATPGKPLPSIPGSVPPPGAWPVGCHFAPRCSYATAQCSAAVISLTQLDGERSTRCVHHDDLVRS